MSAPTRIFDRTRLASHRRRSASLFDRYDFLFRETASRLQDRLRDVDRDFHAALDLGARCSVLGGKALVTADLDPALRGNADRFVTLDEEFLPIRPGTLDLVVSNLCLHWTNDLPGALLQIRQALKLDGLFLAAMLGGETLKELRAALTEAELELTGGAAPRIAPFADIRDAGALLQRAGFALPVTDLDTLTVTYDNAFALMAELRGMGETNTLAETPAGVPMRELFPRAAAIYQDRFSDAEGRIPATFQIIYLHGWAPDSSQQQPLKPGSAENRLSDALNSLEISAGEEAKPDK
ncbi:MAG: SAM-dependent methyltransferase [Rhodospirillaceae bacterium]|mgnify:CR=1 FL=1|nr:SAM-dependent methyltransferase [Rhodospirillaceae bacterium]HAA91876.1 SAM-dependent methyltransferase [Rhodospirillaceae bacterium]